MLSFRFLQRFPVSASSYRLCALSTAAGRKLEGRVAIVTASTDGYVSWEMWVVDQDGG